MSSAQLQIRKLSQSACTERMFNFKKCIMHIKRKISTLTTISCNWNCAFVNNMNNFTQFSFLNIRLAF